jgi:hypothetical protein
MMKNVMGVDSDNELRADLERRWESPQVAEFFFNLLKQQGNRPPFYSDRTERGRAALARYGLQGASKIYFARNLDHNPERGYILNPDKQRTTYIMRRTHLADRWCNKVCPRLRTINGFNEAATAVANNNRKRKASEITTAGHRQVANSAAQDFGASSSGHLSNKFEAYRTKKSIGKEW